MIYFCEVGRETLTLSR